MINNVYLSEVTPLIEGNTPQDNIQMYDIFLKLLKERIIFLNNKITSESSNIVISQLLLLDFENQTQPISIYINCAGGLVTGGLGIYDAMQNIKTPIQTIGIGQVCSMATLLLAAGTPGLRMCLPNTTIVMHQPWGNTQGQASDIKIQSKAIHEMKKKLVNIYKKHIKQNDTTLAKLIDKNSFLTPKKALDIGLIDLIINS